VLGGLSGLAADWPQFLGPSRNGVSAETGLLKSWPANGPAVLWEKDIGTGFSGPVVSGSALILFHRVGDNEVVECLGAADGKERWKFDYATDYRDDFGKGNGPRSTPLVAGNRVITLGAGGQLNCLDLETGKKLWEHSLLSEYEARKGYFGVGTSPLVEGDLVLVNVGGKEAGIVAFDKGSGKEAWRATSGDASYSSPVAATIAGTRHVFFLTREGLVSLDPRTGSVRFSKRWRARYAASVNVATPLVVGDQVFISASYETGAALLGVQKDGVEEIWKGDGILSNHYNTSVYHDGFLYGVDGRQEERAQLRCVEWKTGKVRWTQERFGCAFLILAEGSLVALGEDGDLVLIEATPQAYREKARVPRALSRGCRAPLALANGRLYGRDERKLICWDLKK
jgi:outer membrane protein assembly factor BamB